MNVEYENMRNENHEEIFRGYEIYVEPNPDHYSGGYVWSVCKDDDELECGLAFTKVDALAEAKKTIEAL